MALIFGHPIRPAGYTFQGHAGQIGAGLSCHGTWRASSTLRVLVSRTMARRGVLLDTGPPALILWHDVELFLAGDIQHRFVCPQPLLPSTLVAGSGQDFDPTWIEPR